MNVSGGHGPQGFERHATEREAREAGEEHSDDASSKVIWGRSGR